MDAATQTRGYLLMFSGGKDWDENLSDEELREIMDRYTAWTNRLTASGKVAAGQALGPEGRTVSGANRRVLDGPFAESKEAVGGFLHVMVDSFEEALEIARACPGLDLGGRIEIRPVLNECPTWKRASARLNRPVRVVAALPA